MNELQIFNKDIIPVYITEKGEKVVYGRELYQRLEISKKYNDWIDNMIGYGFSENTDYEEFWQKESEPFLGNAHFKSPQQAAALGYSKNHLLKFDMAKHIAMIQRTPQGMAVRQKLIDLEKDKPACIEDVLIQSLQEMKNIRLEVQKQSEVLSALEDKSEKQSEAIQTVKETLANAGKDEDYQHWVTSSLNKIAKALITIT